MSRYTIFAVMFLLSGCSSWTNQYLNWDFLNPWAKDKTEIKVEDMKDISTGVNADRVNKYLWNAGVEKLSFMGFDKKDEKNGVMETAWKSPKSAANERFKIIVNIKGAEFRADALDLKIYKEIKSKKGWQKAKVSHAFYVGVEQEIINRAKILYINDKNEEF